MFTQKQIYNFFGAGPQVRLLIKLLPDNSDFYYKFEDGTGGAIEQHYAIFCPGQEVYTDHRDPGDWASQLRYFTRWLELLIRELNAPNKWDRLFKEISEINLNFKVEEEKFSYQEFQDIQNKINLLKDNIKEIGLSYDQMELLNSKLDFLIESAQSFSKFDWKSLFIGTIISVTIQIGLTPEHTNILWTLIKHIFNLLFLN